MYCPLLIVFYSIELPQKMAVGVINYKSPIVHKETDVFVNPT